MVKVRIEMDEGWYWYPKFVTRSTEETDEVCAEFPDNLEMQAFIRQKETPSMEISTELLKEYETVRDAHTALMYKFEALYRKQEGLFMSEQRIEEMPEHRMLNEN